MRSRRWVGWIQVWIEVAASEGAQRIRRVDTDFRIYRCRVQADTLPRTELPMGLWASWTIMKELSGRTPVMQVIWAAKLW